MKRISVLAAMVAATMWAAPASAAVMYVGTFAGNDSLTAVNTAITTYNGTNDPDLPAAELFLAKLDCTAKVGNDECPGFTETDGALDASLFDIETSGDDAKSGTWSFLGAPGYSVTYFAVKGGNQFALYYLDPALTSGTVDWDTTDLLVGRGNNPALSHLTWYGSFDEPCSGPDCPGDEVPEPTTLALLGIGLLGAGYARRRR